MIQNFLKVSSQTIQRTFQKIISENFPYATSPEQNSICFLWAPREQPDQIISTKSWCKFVVVAGI